MSVDPADTGGGAGHIDARAHSSDDEARELVGTAGTGGRAAGAHARVGSDSLRTLEGVDPADTERWLPVVMHAAFFLLLGASLARFLIRHPGEPRTPWIIALSAALAVLYVLGPALGSRPTPRRLAWLGGVVATWMVLVVLAPSFAWCAVPLFYTGLRTLRPRAALVLVGVLTAFVVTAQVELSSEGFDPNLVLAPPAVAAIATAVFVQMQRQADRQDQLAYQQRKLIDDLLRTRRELAATERREGTLAERQRLSMEIHDTLAQGLSSQQMLLQAADRVWAADPDAARRHVRTAESIAERNLAEARRFVHDLAPADLAEGGGLDEALRTLAARESAESGSGAGPGSGPVEVRCHIDGAPNAPLPDRVGSALLRIAQGALANVREHAGATTAALTLTYLGDQVVLDIADDGRGFIPGALDARGDSGGGSAQGPAPGASADDSPPSSRPPGVRGHGLPAMYARVRQLGGSLTVESAPGEGTVLSASIPLEPRP
ncbi:sensor histidine kinase [Streptomyces violascens]|uniref:Two-component sensor histidine kinase n=1 Tax=Streptomyces violascens TaxID=67381 RepID=A0ABQ3QQB3_9ACTN|nr:sensor histidine kinase [Streptomyces violascens]GGU20353.1 two-component sensor histidine kinase [Streptomyces violascens]GHI39469.1 two-component sensor histidine kinase [Streptomyces violascens]